MWPDTISSIESIIGSIAIIVTSVAGLALPLREAFKKIKGKGGPPKDDKIIQGQAIPPAKQWLIDLREDSEEADLLREQLQMAVLRLAENGLPYSDILELGKA